MTMVDDHPDGPLDDDLERRLRTAGSTLRREADLRSLRGAPSAQPPVARTVAFAIAVVVVLVGGLLAIGRRDDHLDPATPDPDLPWIIPDLGDGSIGVPRTTSDGDTAQVDDGPDFTVFATADDPSGPVIIVRAIDAPYLQTTGAIEERDIAGRSVVTAATSTGAVLGWVEVDGQWYEARSNAVDRRQLETALGGLTIGADGVLDVPGDLLPSRAQRHGSLSPGAADPAYWQFLREPWPGLSLIDYTVGEDFVLLASRVATEMDLPALVALSTPPAVDAGGGRWYSHRTVGARTGDRRVAGSARRVRPVSERWGRGRPQRSCAWLRARRRWRRSAGRARARTTCCSRSARGCRCSA